MGSGGSSGTRSSVRASDFTSQDISEFAASTNGKQYADLFRNGLMADIANDPKQGTFTEYYTSAGIPISQDIADSFKNFVKNRNASAAAHDAYVQALKDQPGRSATLISPLSGQETKTLIGQKPGKTVLS